MNELAGHNPNTSFPGSSTLFNHDLFGLKEVVLILLDARFWLASVVAIIALILLSSFRKNKWLVEAALRCLHYGGPVPSHVAFIMDGNRRWARRDGLQAHEGHPHGGNKLVDILQWCLQAGIRTVTVYAFSIENFKRPKVEVEELFNLTMRKLYDFQQRNDVIHSNRVRVRIMGDLSLLPADLRASMAKVMMDTMHYSEGPTLNICFAYTSRHDIATAVHDVSELCLKGHLEKQDLSESVLAAYLSSGYTKGAEPDRSYPELVVRTSGETRLSDFLLWETADSVLSFYPTLWPDLSAWDLIKIIIDYQGRSAFSRRKRLRESTDTIDSQQGVGAGSFKPPLTKENERVRRVLDSSRQQYEKKIASYCAE